MQVAEQISVLADLARDVELFHDAHRTAWATFPTGPAYETWPLNSREFKLWASERFFRFSGRPPSQSAVREAVRCLEFRALFEGPEISVQLRVAEQRKSIFIDLGDPSWRAIEITPSGWHIKSRPPVKFRRSRGMLDLLRPVRGGHVEELREFLNVHSNDWPIVLAWLVTALRPCGPYPVMVLSGEQGSAKSVTARILRELVDPREDSLLAEPRNPEDLMLLARNCWLLAIDNVSSLTSRLSDGLCRLATGGSFAKRRLWTDDDLVFLCATRPVILTSIEHVVTRGDLLDRSLVVELPRIRETCRRAEDDLFRRFRSARPRILGALLSAVSVACKNLSNVRLEKLPRMADFARWATAAEPALGLEPGAFLRAYESNRAAAQIAILEGDVVAQAVISLARARHQWEGTATELGAVLPDYAPAGLSHSRLLPRDPRILSGRLRRLTPDLRAVGVELSNGHVGRDAAKRKTIGIRHMGDCDAPAAPTTPT